MGLPEGWVEANIGDIAQIVSGGTPKSNDESNFSPPGTEIAWLTPADLSGYKKKEISFGRRDLSQKGLKTSSAKLMPKGAVLFSSRAPIGYVVIAENEISTNQGFKSFVFISDVSPSYAYFYLRSIRSLAESLGTGTTFKELSSTAAKKLPFILPPLNEQIRISNKLDSLLAKVEIAQNRLEKIPVLLKRFRQSVLAAATSGELTRDWRENNYFKSKYKSDVNWDALDEKKELFPVPENWSWVSFGGVVDIFNSKRKPLKQADRDGRAGSYPYYGAFGVIDHIDDFIFDGDFLLLAEDGKNLESRIRPISLIAGGQFWVNNHAHVMQGKKDIAISYLMFFLNSPLAPIDQFLTGMDQVKLNKNAVVKIPTPIPSIEEQTEIVRRVESLFAQADKVEAQYKAAKTRLDKLTQSILAKAFRGELVPQDPNDEPASELLKRIQAEREQQPKTKPKRARKKSAVSS